MIPLRVSLKNFLCYQDQAFEFGDHPVWLLHGPNGVGKSAIFDGMVYALFGKHKRSDAIPNFGVDLIRRGESSLRVEFDFGFGDKKYQVWRTRSKSGTITQGVFKLEGDRKIAVRDVKNARELDAWVLSTLGLSYETFVSAVLLRQGAAEKLIDSDKETRRQLFRGIIDLEPYIELYEKVNGAKTDLAAIARSLNADLQNKPKVSEEEILAATQERTAADTAWDNALESQKIIGERVGAAQLWESYESERKEVRGRLDQAAQRAAMADALSTRFDRLCSLREVVPALISVKRRRGELDVAVEERRRLVDQQSKADIRRSSLSESAENEKQKASAKQGRISEIQRLNIEANSRRERLLQEIARADRAKGLHNQLAEKKRKFAEFETDIDDQLDRATREYCESKSASESLSYLELIAKYRVEYRKAADESSRFAEDGKKAAAQVERLTQSVNDANLVAEDLERQRTEAQQEQAVASGRLSDLRRRQDDFSSLAQEALCSACGQRIDEEHAARETLKIEQEIVTAAGDLDRCSERVASLIDLVKSARDDHSKKLEYLKQAEIAKAGAEQSRLQAETRVGDARRSFEEAKEGLPDEVGLLVLDVTAEGFPTNADIESSRNLKLAVKARERRKNELASTQKDRDDTTKEISTLTEAVAAIGAPSDVSAARGELAAAEATINRLGEENRRLSDEMKAAETAEVGFRKELETVILEINRLIADGGGAEVSVKNAEDNLANSVNKVPDSYRNLLDDLGRPLNALSGELDDLESSNVEMEWKALASDRSMLAGWNQQLKEVELRIAELPSEACHPVSELKPLQESANQLVKQRDKLRLEAISKLDGLKRQHSERCDIEKRLAEAETKHTLHKALAELLGDKGIQIDLIRDAEQRIVQLANEILVRVSSGDLSIEPPDPEGERSFDLFVRRAGCPESIAAANLSGGQRFRLAVSLALAVCKFASGERLPLESVIIDEGFGSLDREGRMAMITELRDGHELKRMFKRVLIVSHQDDFASAFPVGYLLSSQDGTTVVEPFDRR